MASRAARSEWQNREHDGEHQQSPASVRLVGGGRDADRLAPFFADFVTEATARHTLAAPPRVHALLVLEPDDDESIGRFETFWKRPAARWS